MIANNNKMKKAFILLILFFFCSCKLDKNKWSNLYEFNSLKDLSSKITFQQALVEDDLHYYTFFPSEISVPALVVLEGSYVYNKRTESILRLFKHFDKIINEAECGLVFMEKRGVTPWHFDREKFHRFNTPSQRFSDHLKLFDFLKKNPPQGWNGNFIILGGSEGGPIAIKLAKEIHAIGCIVLAGCGDRTFQESIWHAIQNYLNSKSIRDRLTVWWCDLPKTYSAFKEKCRLIKSNPTSKKMWFGQTYLYWSDAFDQEEKTAFLNLNCPTFVVAGSEDPEESSTQRLMYLAEENNKNVVYKCVKGMGHDILGPKWKVINMVIDFINISINTNTS